ncbi:hypothetical protein COV42_00215 [Candidatus Campbellbacteria bacterium CG11_big_fil_rev_8_21_14_0_20_44_21]|uniref:Yip1 domain-containing protein n=1 Tax=Candidatus Campbellbacteria bacterium CG22_combo_CG10-13_8_21_14_all_43_18 TaxID=1974530 RepID=A0A2H0DWS3_9BACT|nr:MAG: hypothetical protein COW82_01175 [Candidatus Campbellbacteria bacterium CG22_combo_CG10-13_8_21_14_all_43_18]PIR24501.1 MAG: hypothetical protein COV42_00215 [Candidatus Campbellbacteria bacterium CG11_big_fil_rev_8_21_14_0_20_44_21]
MKKILVASAYFLPLLAFAQDETVGGLIPLIRNLINTLTPIVVALALLYFFWGLARFILASGNEVEKDKGKDMMLYGIIALFVMVSVWGIVGLLGDTLGIEQGGSIDAPRVNIN